jgi:cation transport ATPase-like protein
VRANVRVNSVAGQEGIGLIDAARLPPATVLERLESSDSGLSSAEAARRLVVYGHNAIRSHGARAPAILWNQLRNPLLILLAGATVVALITGEVTDAIIILAIVALSVGLGFFFSGRLPHLPAVPVANLERSPAVQAIERLASRWTVPSLRLGREASPPHRQ